MRTLTRNGYLDANNNLVKYPEWVKQEMDRFWSAVIQQIKEDFQEDIVDQATNMYYLISGQEEQFYHVDLVEDSFQMAIACNDKQLSTQHIPHQAVLSVPDAMARLGVQESSKEKMSFSWCLQHRSAELVLSEDEKESAWQELAERRKAEDPTFGKTVDAGGFTYTGCKGIHRGPPHVRGKKRKLLLVTASVRAAHKHYDGTLPCTLR